MLGGKLDPGVDQEEVHLNPDIGQGSVSGGTQLDKMLELAKFGDMELVVLGGMVLAGLELAWFDRDMPHPLQLRRPGG